MHNRDRKRSLNSEFGIRNSELRRKFFGEKFLFIENWCGGKFGFVGLFTNVKRFVFTKPSSGRKGDHEVVEGARVQQKI